MIIKVRYLTLMLIVLIGILTTVATAAPTWTPLPVDEDPLLRQPGTQPTHGVDLDGPDQCHNCHADYDPDTEPFENWQGSMMSQAMRDFLFWPTVAVAAQDSIWVLDNPNATDLCMRCHSPAGWLRGHSDPTNGADMAGDDFDGVQCTTCHYMYDPFFETTFAGTREGDDWTGYWDETDASNTPSSAAALTTYNADAVESSGITMFNDDSFYTGNVPPIDYTENGGGQYFISTDLSQRRASFADANANHGMLYSRYHKSKYFCSTCHDVSNPVLQNLGADPTQPLPSETDPAYSYYHVERTFSEFMLSDFGLQGGAPGSGTFAPDVFDTSQPNNYIASCQDCHMRDVPGKGADKNQAVLRPTESDEHPGSGVPQHDLTGGNVWVTTVLASTVSGSPIYDAFNAAALRQGSTALTLDLDAGEGLNPDALLAGAARAQMMLQAAGTITDVVYSGTTGVLNFTVQNHTGHKLISGFPEGRRMFVNVRYYGANDELLYEVNPYDAAAGTLKGLTGYIYDDPTGQLPDPVTLSVDESYVDSLVYEMKPASSITGETTTFHFVLGTERYKDNRIPPRGFRIGEAIGRISEPVWAGSPDIGYYDSAEYAGGYDAVTLTDDLAVPNAIKIEITVYYQTTSREYVEFLRNEINETPPLTLPDTAYLIQSDPFFDGLRAWGDTIWDVWVHNKDSAGAAPIEMAQAVWEADPTSLTTRSIEAGSPVSTWSYSIHAMLLLALTGLLLTYRKARSAAQV
ncbi:MAG: cytochrome c family protein [Anaerolineae bacterium]|nr:cytochrome c family protein [Anaerolineae bacterium]